MKRVTLLFAILLVGCAGMEPQTPEPQKVEAPKTLESLDIALPRPASEADVTYLGLEGSSDSFRMGQIKAQNLIFGQFPLHCQRHAHLTQLA